MSKIPKIMTGVWLSGHGDMDKLEIRDDIPVPVPGPSDVLIKVGAAGVNNTDINTRVAWYSKGEGDSEDASWAGEPLKFPRIQGIDVCGRIVAAGNAVDRDRIGQRVLVETCLWEVDGKILDSPWFLGSECDGGFAQYVKVASRHAHAIDSDFSDAELASFPCSYSTAENCLTRSGVSKRDIVLVTGASGGVGSAAVQLIKARDARVIAVAGPAKLDTLKKLGADQVVSRDEDLIQVLGSSAVDVVVDLVAGPTWPTHLDLLKPGGRYAVAGAVAGPIVELDVRTLYLKDLSFFGCTALEAEVFPNLVRIIEEKRISPLVAKTFELAQIKEAQQMFMDKQYVGKIVLTVP
ncbi:MAG: alcohol dehydrogenase [Desulfobacteraceae bacterium]|nr:MAG: alcohol dehydrogenase [Desulfobacteraceae bacterium]